MSASSSDEDTIMVTPAELQESGNTAELSFLPEKSREKYIKAYEAFTTWRQTQTKGSKMFSESLMLSYFNELSKTRKCSTLWSIYSMLKACIKSKNDVHIENYAKLIEYLRKTANGHKPKKSKVLTASNIEQFLNDAPDCKFLATKVALIIGISGACRTHELTYLTLDNVQKPSEKLLLVTLPNTNSKMQRNFVIRDEYVHIIEKYQALRPANTPINRFFLQYRHGKCFRQPMGTTKIGGMPREIATFLKLSEPKEYTGHCFRRTAATLIVDTGADMTTLKCKNDWKCNKSGKMEGKMEDSTTKGSTEHSIENIPKICNVFIEEIKLEQYSPESIEPKCEVNTLDNLSESPTDSFPEWPCPAFTTNISNLSQQPDMSKRTALNENYKGLVESFSIPAEIHERNGKKYASFGSAVPVHVCSPDEVAKHANTTHHYCDIFSEQTMASLGELAFVRLDENTAEKVFINRSKRILVVSSDGVLAQWRCAPSFESANQYMAGTPIVNKEGELVSLVTAKRGNHYAVSNIEGEGGYFETTEPWDVRDLPNNVNVYGDKVFATRDELRSYVTKLPPPEVNAQDRPKPIVYRGNSPRLVLVAKNGRQLTHIYLHGVATTHIDYV